ncbi:MAG: hypothetical protein KGS46_09225 [Chloroflexi bacterium]|nr:hypothetical protein [Chloroflexota bacterium]
MKDKIEQPKYVSLVGLAARIGRKLKVHRMEQCSNFVIQSACNADYFARGQDEHEKSKTINKN